MMKTSSRSHSLEALLTSNSQLKQLTVVTRQLQRLYVRVRGQLPPNLVGHFLGAQWQKGTLVIYMDNSASATLLRYQQRELAYRLATVHLSANHIKVQVAQPPIMNAASRRTAKPLPAVVRTMLESTAATLEDGPLSRSLRNLARRHGSR